MPRRNELPFISIEKGAHPVSRSFFDDQHHASAVDPIRD